MKSKAAFLFSFLLGVGLLGGCHSLTSQKLTEGEQYFLRHVKPVLEDNCLRCHNGFVLPGRLDLSNRATAMASRIDGKPFFVAGKPDESPFIQAISRKGSHPKIMPRLEMSLTDDQIGALHEWIEDGAAWPSGKAGDLAPAKNPEIP